MNWINTSTLRKYPSQQVQISKYIHTNKQTQQYIPLRWARPMITMCCITLKVGLMYCVFFALLRIIRSFVFHVDVVDDTCSWSLHVDIAIKTEVMKHKNTFKSSDSWVNVHSVYLETVSKFLYKLKIYPVCMLQTLGRLMIGVVLKSLEE